MSASAVPGRVSPVTPPADLPQLSSLPRLELSKSQSRSPGVVFLGCETCCQLVYVWGIFLCYYYNSRFQRLQCFPEKVRRGCSTPKTSVFWSGKTLSGRRRKIRVARACPSVNYVAHQHHYSAITSKHPEKCHFLYFFERPLQQFCTTVQTVISVAWTQWYDSAVLADAGRALQATGNARLPSI